jgi:hypothetical protein
MAAMGGTLVDTAYNTLNERRQRLAAGLTNALRGMI